jgi:hypothetical protein
MKIKNFIAAGLAGGFIDWILGWFLYGVVFKSTYYAADAKESDMNLAIITLGCFSVGFLMSYCFTQISNQTNVLTGLKNGAIFGLLLGFSQVFFDNERTFDIDYQVIAITQFISVIMGACVGATIAFVNGKIK